MKRGSIAIILLLLIPIASAVDVSYKFSQENVFFDVYKCGNTCDNLNLVNQNQAEGNSLVYSYQENGWHAYAAYKNCFYPVLRKAEISEVFQGQEVNINLEKREICSSGINGQISVSSNFRTNENANVKVNVKGIFSNDFVSKGYISRLPDDRKEFLTAIINIKLFDNNVLVEEKKVSLYLDESKNVEFTWKPANPGSHRLKVETSTDDCKCYSVAKISKDLMANVEGYNGIKDKPAITTQQAIVAEQEQNFASCEGGDGCNSGCKNGDPDCSCDMLSGYICKEGENCEGTLMRNYGDEVCCSVKCSKGTEINGGSLIRYFTSEKIPEENRPKDLGKEVDIFKESVISSARVSSMLITLALFFLIVFVIFAMHQTHFPIDPLKSGIEFVKKEEEKLFRKKDNKKEVKTEVKNNKDEAFLNDIISKLSKDEAKIVNMIKEKSIKQDELRSLLGFTKEKLNYNLIRLERRQIIKKRVGDNPQIELNEWLLK